MTSLDKKCCVPDCGKTRADNVILHFFPNPDIETERFRSWLYAIRGDILALSNKKIHKDRRVCHDHFETRFHTSSKRLAANSVPTLNLPGSIGRTTLVNITNPRSTTNVNDIDLPSTSKGLTSRTPFTDITNKTIKNTNDDVEMPPVSKGSTSRTPHMVNATHQSTNDDTEIPTILKEPKKLKGNQSTIFSSEASNLYRQLTKCKAAKEKYAARLKKALKLSSNVTFQKALRSFTSAALIFILLQFREVNKSKMGRRFTKKEKIMALSFYKRGPKAYRWLRKLFVLPSPATLSRVISRANLKTGINENIFELLKKKAKNMSPSERICVLLFDEISIAPHFDYNKKRDEITGFVDNGKEKTKVITDHALVFMVRGIQRKYKQPLYYTFCSGSTEKVELAVQVKEVIQKLKASGFSVIATICDQGSTNVSAIKYLIAQTRAEYIRSGKEFKEAVFVIDGEEIIPLFDPPHLIKGIRNNLLNKNLMCTMNNIQKVAKWDHILKLHNQNPAYQGIRLLPKLTENHVNPKKIPKMKVKCATQVFSRTVAVNMGFLADIGVLEEQCKQTADVLLFFDELFDSVNGSFAAAKKHAGKPALGPLTPNSSHQKIWEKAKPILQSIKFCTKDGKTTVIPTTTNWLHTINNFMYLKQKIFRHDFKSIWLRNFNQDPLENFFGSIRSHGIRYTNPTSTGFEGTFASLLINNLSSVHSVGSNCEKDSCFAFKSFKKLFNNAANGPLSNRATEVDFDHLGDHILVNYDQKIKNLQVKAQMEYVTGYVLRKNRRIFKNCPVCKDCLFDETNTSAYINKKELAAKRKRLTYPANNLVKSFSNIQDVVTYIIRRNANMPNIKQYLKTIISYHINFDFISCPEHRDPLIKNLVDVSCNFFLNNWCREINKILKGKIKDCDINDYMQMKARNYFEKRNKSSS